MLVLSLIRRIKHEISLVKAIITPIMLTISGVVGTMLLYFIETGKWGGISFYGSVFFIPLCMIPYSLIIKEKIVKILDFSVPQICIMLAAMKVNCLTSGCCYGIELFTKNDGTIVRFPSQFIEMIVALGIMIIFIYLVNTGKYTGRHYALFFVLYGIIRFALNFLRGDLSAFISILPAGHFWSIIAMIIGTVWLFIADRKKPKSE